MDTSFRRFFPALVLAMTLLTSLACGGSASDQLADAVETPNTETGAADTSDVEAGPTATARPQASPTPKPEAITIVQQGFGQDGNNLGFAFIVSNPNEGFSVESSQYQLAAYDAAGAVVKTDSGYIELLLPGQTLGVGGSVYVDDGVTVDKVEVQISPGDVVAAGPLPTFSVDKAVYTPGGFSSQVTGIITSPYKRAIENVRVSAVLYNTAGDIVGGGSTFLNFIAAGGTAGTLVPVNGSKEVAKVELYPMISALSLLAGDDGLPSGATEAAVVKQGFGQDETAVGYGFLVENPNAAFSIEGTRYHITAYAEDGTVLTVDQGFVDLLLPKQTLGVGGSLYLNEGEIVAQVVVQLLPGDFAPSEVLPFFTAENITYQPGSFSDSVTGEIVSPYAKDITNVRVSAIAYSAAGEIIGGGFTYVDFAPANGKAAVETSLTVAGEPAMLELYAATSTFSDIK